MIKIKQHHLIEALMVVLIFSIMLYVFIPKALQSQHRAQISQLEETLQTIKTLLEENPNDSKILFENARIMGGGSAGPLYNQAKNELTLFYYKEDMIELMTEKLERYDQRIDIPEWTLSTLKLYGYAVYAKKSPKHITLDGFSDKPAYVAIMARVGEDLTERLGSNHVEKLYFEPYSVRINGDGNIRFETYTTPFNVSNGLKSYGEFLVDTTDIWDATKAVILTEPQKGFAPQYFTGFNWNTTIIIRGE